MFDRFNPAAIGFAVGAVLTAIAGLGVVVLTDVQIDLVVTAVAAVLAILGVAAVPTAQAASRNEEEAYVDGLYTKTPENVGY